MKNIFSSLACLMLCSLSALGHGSMADPISRSYEVFLENPESPTSAAGRAAVAVAGTQAFYDWDEVNLRVPNYDYQALIPNGMLASAGRAKYAGIDLPRTDWPATAMVAGPRVCRFHLHTPHDPSFFKAYITKEGYDPTQPLKWSDLVLIPGGETATLNGFDYFMTLQFPERVGRHLLYVIWQRIDPANEAFFSTSDLDFGGVDYGAPPPPPVISATVAFSHTNAWTGGGQAAFRITNQTNQNIESWTLEFDWAADVSSVWNGVLKSKVGTHYVVTNADYNARILPGAFIDVGCVANFSTPGLLPTDLGCVGIGGFISSVCSGDVNGDRTVDAADVGGMLSNWGSSSPTYDLNKDGVTDSADLADVLGAWGVCQ